MKMNLSAVLTAMSLLIPLSATANNCIEHARNAMEESYCQVKATRYGSRLPSLYRFRKNNEQTQRLILNKPAQRAGISLPPERAAKAENRTSPKQGLLKPAAPSNAAIHLPEVNLPADRSRAAHLPTANLPAHQATPSLSGCQLQRQKIICPHGIYRLLVNQQNTQLKLGALEPHNRLTLPQKNHPTYRSHTHTQYLSALYKIYLGKMLEIGLAGATMSYTKFVSTYQLHVNNRTSPHERFATMFELLKKERQTQSVKRRYSEALPQHIDQCMTLNTSLIVCDDIQTNWVFSK